MYESILSSKPSHFVNDQLFIQRESQARIFLSTSGIKFHEPCGTVYLRNLK